ncbi:monomeric sarcosine oxidase-like [Amphiura filiformis]|uniref:monomeric sarcosine oxidase-like n=1 Tax=Amphiura filiformis TaxID=82378 RepID=UPI003B210AE8
MADRMYDVCIIGAGMWGSAAAYHTCLVPDTKVCLIGPEEPTSSQEFNSRAIHGAYYDEVRVTRTNMGSVICSELSKRSHEGFDKLEKNTGISFYTECNNVNFGPVKSQYITDCKRTSELLQTEHVLLTGDQLTQKFPYLNMALTLGSNIECILQLSKCGLVNPRKLVAAQKTAADLHGCDIFNTTVDQITEKYHTPSVGKILEVVTEDGQIIRSRKVLICTGVFTLSKPLLPSHLLPDMKLVPTQTLRIELSKENVDNMRDMPSICSFTREDNQRDGYICPPVIYPDGKTYLKIGHGRLRYLKSEEVAEWYRSDGDPEVTEKLMGMMKRFFPGLIPISTHTDTCAVTVTRTDMPYVDMVTPEIGVAIGDNGGGAKFCYEIGRMAAKMIAKGCWDYDLPAREFEVRFKEPKQ